MLNTATLGGFVATQNAAEARKFYEEVLGLTFVGDEPYALVFDANGTSLRVQKVYEVVKVPYTVLGWHVSDIESVVAQLTEKGVEFMRVPGFDQDDLGIVTFPGGARVAWFTDPDGNTLSLDQIE